MGRIFFVYFRLGLGFIFIIITILSMDTVLTIEPPDCRRLSLIFLINIKKMGRGCGKLLRKINLKLAIPLEGSVNILESFSGGRT